MQDKRNTQILLINDMAGYGKVALSVMIPVLSHLRFETFNLPTALVSNTLDYGRFDILDTTDYMRNTIGVWQELGFGFDAICTGFIVSEQQSALVYEYCRAQRESGTAVFVDPIMGDDGRLYNGVTPETVGYMRRLCSIADVIAPNITEACFLAEYELKPSYTAEDVEAIADKLNALGARALVLTSVNVEGRTCTAVKPAPDAGVEYIGYEEIPVRFPGTGDIFMAVMTGHYMKTGRLIPSVRAAMRQLERIISANRGNADKYKGIPIEQYLEEISCEEAED